MIVDLRRFVIRVGGPSNFIRQKTDIAVVSIADSYVRELGTIMSNILQVGLLNMEPAASKKLRDHIQSLSLVRFVTEVQDEEGLANVLNQTPLNLVFFHLDPKPSKVLDIIDQVSQHYPDTAMIALSHETSPEAILAPIRAGCDQYVCEPIDSKDLAAAVARVVSKRFLSHGMSRCICVTGASGGAGATSIASNLAMEIGQLTEKKVVLVDLGLQFGDLAVNFDIEPKYTLHDAATMGTDLDRTVLENIVTPTPCNLALLPRPTSIEQVEQISPDAIHHIIATLRDIYETVVIDVPRHMNPCSFAALGQADMILVICQLLVPSIRNANRLVDSLKKLGVPEERIEVVPNRGDSSGGRITVKDLESLINKPVFACVPNDYHYVAQSIDFGQPLAAADKKKNPVRDAIQLMARKIVTGAMPETDLPGQRRGLLGRLLSK